MFTVQNLAAPLILFSVAATFLAQSYYPIPELKDLSTVTGPATVREETNWSHKENYTKWILSVQNSAGNKTEEFEILNWYPSARSLRGLVQPDQLTTVWKDSWGYPWQIEQDGKFLVSYASMCDVVAKKHSHATVMAGVLCFFGVPVTLFFQRFKHTLKALAPGVLLFGLVEAILVKIRSR